MGAIGRDRRAYRCVFCFPRGAIVLGTHPGAESPFLQFCPRRPPHFPGLEKPVRHEAAPRIPALGHWNHVAVVSRFCAAVPQAVVKRRDARGHRVSLWVLPRLEEPHGRARPEGPNWEPNRVTFGVPECCRGGLLGSFNGAINTVLRPCLREGAAPSRSRGPGSRLGVRVRCSAPCASMAGLGGHGSGAGTEARHVAAASGRLLANPQPGARLRAPGRGAPLSAGHSRAVLM